MATYREATKKELAQAQQGTLTLYVLEELPAPTTGDIRLCEMAHHVLENHEVVIVSGPDDHDRYEIADKDDYEEGREDAMTYECPGWALTNTLD